MGEGKAMLFGRMAGKTRSPRRCETLLERIWGVIQNLIMKGMRILIPSNLRLDVLDKIHQGHLGITKCRERAKQSVWWPGLSTQVQDMVQSCRTCAMHLVRCAGL